MHSPPQGNEIANEEYLYPHPPNLDSDLTVLFKTKTTLQLLQNRGIKELRTFLTKYMYPINYGGTDLADSKSAAKFLIKSIQGGKKITIYGDYDADGVISTAILWDFIYRVLNYKNISIYIPSRIEEGYGLNDNALSHLYRSGTEVIITVDCGITSADLIKKWQTKLKFIITDHHTIPSKLPSTYIVHPKLPQSTLINKETSGATVIWKFIQRVAKLLNKNYELIAFRYLDLVALSLITDVMPLEYENRTIVKEGLNKLKTAPNLGLETLYYIATGKNIKESHPSTRDLGFILGPRLNAAGRLKDPIDALRLITTHNKDYAKKIATTLHILNKERQEITESQTKIARDNLKIIKNTLAVAYHPEFNEGIIGLIAGRIQQSIYLPTIVITKNGNQLKASARSPKEFHITNFLRNFEKLFENFGGHAQAAGFTTKNNDIQNLIKSFTSYFEKNRIKLVQKIKIDAILHPEDNLSQLAKELEILSPWGPSNPRPNLLYEDRIKQVEYDINNLHSFIKTRQGLRVVLWNQKIPSNLKTLRALVNVGFNEYLQIHELVGYKIIDTEGLFIPPAA